MKKFFFRKKIFICIQSSLQNTFFFFSAIVRGLNFCRETKNLKTMFLQIQKKPPLSSISPLRQLLLTFLYIVYAPNDQIHTHTCRPKHKNEKKKKNFFFHHRQNIFLTPKNLRTYRSSTVTYFVFAFFIHFFLSHFLSFFSLIRQLEGR